MPHETTPARPAHPPFTVLLLAWPLGLLLLEATALTPFVEFTVGGMSWLANPFFLTAGIVSLAAFFLIVAATEDLLPPATDPSAVSSSPAINPLLRPWLYVRWRWALVHGGLLALFFWLSLSLHTQARSAVVSWPLSVTWLIVGGAVAGSILLAFVPLKMLLSFASRHGWQAAVAATMGAALVMMTPHIRSYWPVVAGPALEVLNVLLNFYPGQARITLAANQWPIIGTQRISLLVTPACSELDSVLVFVLLAGTLWAARGLLLSPWKYALLLIAALAGMYGLLVLRLYFMILIGVWANSPFAAVKFAHSRISTVALLLYTLGVLYLATRFARPAVQPVTMLEDPVEEEPAAEGEAAPV